MHNMPPRIAIDDDDHEHVVNLVGRSLRRTVLIAAAVASLVAIGSLAANAEPPNVVLGVATMTSQRDCPDGLKVDLTITQELDETWTLVAQPVHASCTFRTDVPLRFEGRWDETGAHPCDLATGTYCFEGTDRPGRLALGSQAAVRALIEVPITYARGTFRMTGTALLYRAGS